MLFGLYLYQNKLLYHPNVEGAEKFPEQNPRGWRNPGDKGMKYRDIEVITKDCKNLKGWFIYQEVNPHLTSTLIYFHENALSKYISI